MGHLYHPGIQYLCCVDESPQEIQSTLNSPRYVNRRKTCMESCALINIHYQFDLNKQSLGIKGMWCRPKDLFQSQRVSTTKSLNICYTGKPQLNPVIQLS